MRWLIAIALVVGCIGLGCGHHFNPIEGTEITTSAVAVGKPAPDATLKTASGSSISLASAFASHDKTVVVFYRGFY